MIEFKLHLRCGVSRSGNAVFNSYDCAEHLRGVMAKLFVAAFLALIPVLWRRLFVPQRYHGIDRTGASCGYVARRQCNRD